jgi:hypothetical protein
LQVPEYIQIQIDDLDGAKEKGTIEDPEINPKKGGITNADIETSG